MTPPPRLHVLIARKADRAVVFRRGPSRQVGSIGWDIRTDRFEPGQWLKGRIYPYRSDLSTDGRHMIYFAMNGRWSDAMGGSWTAVSRAPWLTALHVYPWGDCWNGGGLFLDKWRYWLNGAWHGDALRSVCDRLERVDAPPEGVTPHFGECPGVYLPRLRRDGWRPTDIRSAGGLRQWDFEKPVRPRWTLAKTFHAGPATGPNRECYYETHALIGPDGILPLDAEWADVRKSAILFARNGALWRMRVHAKGPEDPAMIRDFAGLTFEAKSAPYHGVPRERPA